MQMGKNLEQMDKWSVCIGKWQVEGRGKETWQDYLHSEATHGIWKEV